MVYTYFKLLCLKFQDACRPGRPAELNVDKVKLHYVVHYINRGMWDHVVPEEKEKEGKIGEYI